MCYGQLPASKRTLANRRARVPDSEVGTSSSTPHGCCGGSRGGGTGGEASPHRMKPSLPSGAALPSRIARTRVTTEEQTRKGRKLAFAVLMIVVGRSP